MGNGSALRVSRGEADPGLVRIGLCSSEVRARNLACGHTMARYALLDAIQALHAVGWLPTAESVTLQQEVESVSNAIHLLDHQKGDAERTLVLVSERKHFSGDEAGESTVEVRRLEEQHSAYAVQIRELQRAVLAHLDAAIRHSEGHADGGGTLRA